MKGCLGILKIRVAGEDNECPLKALATHLFHEIGTVHARHADVQKHESGLIAVDHVDGFRTASCLSADTKAERIPVDQIFDTFPYHLFIINDQYVDQFIFHC